MRFTIVVWEGGKGPTPTLSSLLRRRPVLLRADFVLKKGNFLVK